MWSCWVCGVGLLLCVVGFFYGLWVHVLLLLMVVLYGLGVVHVLVLFMW